MAPILTIFCPNESQRCQLNFEKNLGRRKNFHEDEKFEKVSRKVRNFLSRTRFLGQNKIETFMCQDLEVVHEYVTMLDNVNERSNDQTIDQRIEFKLFND